MEPLCTGRRDGDRGHGRVDGKWYSQQHSTSQIIKQNHPQSSNPTFFLLIVHQETHTGTFIEVLLIIAKHQK